MDKPVVMKRLPHLNFFRALAAFWVLTAHCFIWAGVIAKIAIPDPKIAVDVFILITGFLMPYTVAARAAKEPMQRLANWPRFYVRRFFRIAPVYYLVLAFVVAMAADFLGGYGVLRALNPAQWAGAPQYDPAGTQYGFTNLALHVSFLFGLLPHYSFSTFLPDWSLGLEMQFYVVFPAIFLAMRRFGPAVTALLLAMTSWALAALVLLMARHGWMPFYIEPSLLAFRLPVFLAGMLVFEAWQRHRPFYVVLAVVLCAPMARSYGSEIVYLLGILLAIAVCTMRPAAVVQRLFSARAVTFAADISYSVYLVHGPVLALVGARIPKPATRPDGRWWQEVCRYGRP